MHPVGCFGLGFYESICVDSVEEPLFFLSNNFNNLIINNNNEKIKVQFYVCGQRGRTTNFSM
jgi:hypothetical protein